MYKKLFLLFLAATSIFAAEHNIQMTVELQLNPVKVIGRSMGLLSDKEILQEKAIASALTNPTDILVDKDFFYRESGDSLFVTVTGFSARYVIVPERPQPALQIPITEVSRYQTSARSSQDGMVPYVSIRAQTLWVPSVIEAGVIMDNLFMSIDGGVGFGLFGLTVGAGTSIGAVMPIKRERFTLILGGSFGYWYLENFLYDGDDNYLFGGPLVKTIFGKKRVRFEISNRMLLGAHAFNYQLGLGIAFIPRVLTR